MPAVPLWSTENVAKFDWMLVSVPCFGRCENVNSRRLWDINFISPEQRLVPGRWETNNLIEFYDHRDYTTSNPVAIWSLQCFVQWFSYFRSCWPVDHCVWPTYLAANFDNRDRWTLTGSSSVAVHSPHWPRAPFFVSCYMVNIEKKNVTCFCNFSDVSYLVDIKCEQLAFHGSFLYQYSEVRYTADLGMASRKSAWLRRIPWQKLKH